MPRTAILYIEERCNQSCVFCLEEDGNWTEFVAPDTAQVCTTIDRVRARGADQITFMGGETFFRKDLPDILRHARSVGMRRLGVTTNGTVLGKPGFVKSLSDSGLDCVEISVHGHTPELARAISRSDVTFPRQARAMAEINATRLVVTIVNVVVCRENAAALRDVARYVLESMPDVEVRFKFKFVSLQGWAAERASLPSGGAEAAEGPGAPSAALRYEDVDFVALGDFLDSRGAKFWFYNVPLCRLGRHAAHSHELSTQVSDERYFDRDHRGTGEYYDSGHQLEGRVWPVESCGSCTVKPLCCGIEETHRLANGASALSPLSVEPLPLVDFALRDMGGDPASAPSVWTRLTQQPRPGTFVRPRPDGAVRFTHPAHEQPLDLEVADVASSPRHYFATEHFALSYRSSGGREAAPGVPELLARATEVLRAVEARCGTLDEVRRGLAGCAGDGWVLDERSELPEGSRRKHQLRLVDNGPREFTQRRHEAT